MRIILLSLLLLAGCSCTNIGKAPVDQFFQIRARDLVDQSKTGNGEGLAKAVPGRPLLINNANVFSTMGDAVLGIAIAVGTISKTVDLFRDMDPLLLQSKLQAVLNEEFSRQHADPQWRVLLAMAGEDRRLILEPYCCLHGHPNAILQLRLRVSLVRGDDIVWTRQLAETSDQRPLQGENSWSANGARQVIEFVETALPGLVKRLPEVQLDTATNL